MLIRIIPHAENQQADYLSWLQNKDDWKINPVVFPELHLHICWGPHTVDEHLNTQLPQFNSLFWSPGTEAVDAFTGDWGGETNWICPPPPPTLFSATSHKADKHHGRSFCPIMEVSPILAHVVFLQGCASQVCNTDIGVNEVRSVGPTWEVRL